ncbi:MAG: glycoside hydrolase family 3 protein [Sedimentisphaerales bacterium]|nr:glycoside hydrolase family 3 protein [Sedimentisphaerales bacterium]
MKITDKIFRQYFVMTCATALVLLLLSGCGWSKKTVEVPLDVRIGRMLMVGFRGCSIEADSPIVRDIQADHLGGVILFERDVLLGSSRRNIESAAQLRQLTADLQEYAGGRLIIAIDQEGGRITRLKEKHGFEPSLSHQALGMRDDEQFTCEQARKIAEPLARLGINLNMAPVVDLALNPDSPVIARLERSFAADPAVVTRQARAYIKAHHELGIACCLKHFPGHGSARADSHLGLTDISDTWQEIELEPYSSLIASGGVDAIMTGHLYNSHLDSKYPATLSRTTLTGLLREKMAYAGPIISDDLQMKAITSEFGLEQTVEQAVLAGVDILLFANNSEYDPDIAAKAIAIIKNMLTRGLIDEKRIDESYRRIEALVADMPVKK